MVVLNNPFFYWLQDSQTAASSEAGAGQMCKHLYILLNQILGSDCHRSADPSASFLVMLFASTRTGTWLLPHIQMREPKQHPRALPTLRQKITPTKLAQSIRKHNRVLYNSSHCSGLKDLSCGLYKAIMFSSRSPTLYVLTVEDLCKR